LDKLVIIPTYNEIGNIKNILEVILALEGAYHVLVVDDASPDGTATVVKSMFEQYPDRLYILEREGKLGLGTAYIEGFRWGLKRSYQFFFEMDADFSHDPTVLPDLLQATKEEGVGMAVGSYCASIYVRMILWMRVRDTTAGFVCYKREVLEKLDLNRIEFVGYAFQIEMKYATQILGYEIREVPITFRDRTIGSSKMSTKIFNEAFAGVWKMRRKGTKDNAYRNSVY